MKVLFVTHYTSMMGANKSMLQLILELREKGVDSTVLMPFSKKSELENELLKNNIPFIVASLRCIKHPTIWKVVPNYLYALFLNKRVLRKLKGQSFDIIHSNSSVINVGAFLASKLKIKHVWHLREFGDIDYNLKTPFGKWFQRIVYSGNNEFIAISQKIYNHFKPYVSADSIIHLIYNGVKPPVEKTKPINNIVQFCIVGLLHENKGQYEVVKAVNELVNKMGIKDFHLTIVGDGTPTYKSKLTQFINNHNLSSFITFTGYRKDVNALLNQMDVGIMASAHEAFGRVTIEYMMAGLAVIASDEGANTEIIQNKQNGMLYQSGSFSALASKMVELIHQPTLLKNLALRARKHALTFFSAKSNAEKVLALYENVLKK